MSCRFEVAQLCCDKKILAKNTVMIEKGLFHALYFIKMHKLKTLVDKSNQGSEAGRDGNPGRFFLNVQD